MAGFVFALCPAHIIAEEPMEPKETDTYSEWVIHKLQQETGGDANPLPAEVITAARVVWPRVVTLLASELRREGSVREAEALAAEIWEGVLRSVTKAAQRNGNYTTSIREPESYLFIAFQHRFHRHQRAERCRRDRFQSFPSKLDLGSVGNARDTKWVLGLERTITGRQKIYRVGPGDKKGVQD